MAIIFQESSQTKPGQDNDSLVTVHHRDEHQHAAVT